MRARALVSSLLAATVVLGLAVPGLASAETTHRFIKQLDLPVNGIKPMGVDPQGNVIVWAEGAIRKFNPNGEPVDFSALGTNAIDGAGGGDCPNTPADCDQTPWNTLGTGESPELEYPPATLADMNQSTTGPTAGYMYVAAIKEVEGVYRGRIFVFDASGRYRGEIDTHHATPLQSPEGVPTFVSVSPHGTIIVTYNARTIGDQYHADKYQPTDADPAHDTFSGQLRKSDPFGALTGGGFALGTVADDDLAYVGRGSSGRSSTEFHPIWQVFDAASFGQPDGDTKPENLDPGLCECDAAGAFGDGGRDQESGGYFETASIDPADHHVYLLEPYPGTLEEWANPTEQVGPDFGDAETIAGSSGQIAFDTSGIASTDGRLYVSRGNSLAVFSGPVPIPNVEELHTTVGHKEAQISARINLDHGPKVSVCRIQWGEEFPEQPVFYSHFVPCEPSAPYPDETTSISTLVTGLTTEQNYRFRVFVKTNNGINRSQPILVRPAAVLSVESEPAEEVTKTTAKLRGSLNSDGFPTTYWFEYGIDTNYSGQTSKTPADEGTGVAQVTPVEIDNLQPRRRYHFRLVASNELGTTYGADQSFVAASPPSISGVRPSGVSETGATLSALINPGGYATTYSFEYGPTPSYGRSAPAGGESIGEGVVPVSVSKQLTGLQPGTEYHFRVVATNAWGTEASEDSSFTFFPPNCPNEYPRQLTRSNYLPDCRAYELVSPGNAGGIQLFPGDLTMDYLFYTAIHIPNVSTYAQNLGTATSPGRFTFLGLSGALPGTNPPNYLIDNYTATRTPNGWVNRYWGLSGSEALAAGGAECDLQMDTCIDYKVPEVLLTTDPSYKGSQAPYVWDFEGHSLGRWPTNVGVVKGGEGFVGDDKPSPDFSHYVFSSNNVKFTTDGSLLAPGSAYDNDVAEAAVKKISVLPGGADIPEGSGTSDGSKEFIKIAAVSTDGSHILMTTQGLGGVNFYMRVGDVVTYPIAEGKRGLRLLGMTSDGSKVVFASPDHVTADDTDYPFSGDIFVWEEQTNEITRVSQGNGAGDSNECQPPESLGLGPVCTAVPLTTERPDSDDAIASASGDVYFYSPEQLDPDNPGIFDAKNLYVYRNGAVKYVATLDAGTAINRIQISPDGQHVAFLTAARLTGYDNQGWREMYGYDPESGVITCESCLPSGEPPAVLRPPEDPNQSGSPRSLPSKDVMASQSGRFMADDGRTAFASSDALVEGDTDGLVDVYEFTGGRPQLISSGTAQSDLLPGSRFLPGEYTGLEAISHDGADIYFTTFDTLAPAEDFNGQFLKFYDARSNGGFTPPAAHLPCVAADECHGDENPAPASPLIGTGAALGTPAGAEKAAKPAHKKKAHKKRVKARKRHHRGRQGQSHG